MWRREKERKGEITDGGGVMKKKRETGSKIMRWSLLPMKAENRGGSSME